MQDVLNRWVLVLAAGAGTRLSSLTTDTDGAIVPKQFCSLTGAASLLEETLERAYAIAPQSRTVVVVAAEQRRFWRTALAHIPAANIVVQPRNRGTANGILLGVTAILQRDPNAALAVLPSDHYVEREAVLSRAILRALAALEPRSDAISFLGIEPEMPDPELGYILCGAPGIDGSYRIAEFVEKPRAALAAELVARGALWNSFILVGRAKAFSDLIARRFPAEVDALQQALRLASRSTLDLPALSAGAPELTPAGQAKAHASRSRERYAAPAESRSRERYGAPAESRSRERYAAPAESPSLELTRLYQRLPDIDFSRHVVQGAAAPLRVVPVPGCGWSDLGTPQRVAECLERMTMRELPALSRHWNLAEAYARARGTRSHRHARDSRAAARYA